ncbi:MAG: rhomboid family intramembrane serine protease [Flavobacteriales bacterium]|nr:rhomboid family intramembrane serine protease [Flavobacteriales bacterium]
MKFSFESIIVPFLFICTLWIVYGLQYIGFFTECHGIIPHYEKGAQGILFAPLFHGSWNHVFNNSIPLFVLLFLSFTMYQKITYLVWIIGWLLSGFLVWQFPYFGLFENESMACHIGASGLVYVFASFLFFSGIIRRNIQLMAISMLVVFLYGSLIWGIFPQELLSSDPQAKYISWESHLSGAVSGILLAYIFRKYGPQRTKFPWQKKNYIDPQGEQLWQEYQEKFPEDFEVDSTEKTNQKESKNDWEKLL